MTFYPLKFWGIELFRLKDEPWGIIGWQGRFNTVRETSILAVVIVAVFSMEPCALQRLYLLSINLHGNLPLPTIKTCL
jgi:hypothetical protein